MTVLPEPLGTMVRELATDPDVQALAKPDAHPTTRNSYGTYMSRIMRLADSSPVTADDRTNRRFWALVLIAAGGNEQGIDDALQAVT